MADSAAGSAAPATPGAAAPAAPQKQAVPGKQGVEIIKKGSGIVAPPNGATKPVDAAPKGETAAEKRARIKLGDEEFDEEDLIQMRVRDRAAGTKFREHAAAKKQWEEEQALIKKDTAAFLKKHGIDPTEWSAKQMLEWDEGQKLSPEQKRIRELEAETEKFKTKAQQEQEAREKEAQEREIAALIPQIEESFNKALAGTGLDEEYIGKHGMQRALRAALHLRENGLDNPPPAAVAAQIRRDLKDDTTAYLSSLKGDSLLTELGDALVERVRLAMLAKHKASRTPFSPPKAEPEQGLGIRGAADEHRALRAGQTGVLPEPPRRGLIPYDSK